MPESALCEPMFMSTLSAQVLSSSDQPGDNQETSLQHGRYTKLCSACHRSKCGTGGSDLRYAVCQRGGSEQRCSDNDESRIIPCPLVFGLFVVRCVAVPTDRHLIQCPHCRHRCRQHRDNNIATATTSSNWRHRTLFWVTRSAAP
jgi:hypothetical protein